MSIIGILVYWNASTDTSVNNYKVYAGTAPTNYNLANSPITTGHVLHTYYPVPGPGRYYFAIAAVSTSTGESNKGTEFSLDVREPTGRVTQMVRRSLA